MTKETERVFPKTINRPEEDLIKPLEFMFTKEEILHHCLRIMRDEGHHDFVTAVEYRLFQQDLHKNQNPNE